MKELLMPKPVCPHCGKPLANIEKLGWHLSRECPVFASSTGTQDSTGKNDSKPERP